MELTAFEQIKAPFDGVVTARNVDIGDLVNAGGNTGRALFQIADVHRMRIYVNVPQAFLGELSPGIKATLHLPGQKETFEAQLVSTSNALVESSRTSLVELQADNLDGKLWPGAFAEVHFHIPADPNSLTVSLTALIFGAKGMQVAALDADDKVALKPVVVGRNFGTKVQIESGLCAIRPACRQPPRVHPDRRQGERGQSGSECGGARRQSRAEQTAKPVISLSLKAYDGWQRAFRLAPSFGGGRQLVEIDPSRARCDSTIVEGNLHLKWRRRPKSNRVAFSIS